jgi:hypothetical protein
MRLARAVLEQLVLHVQPPKGCAIVLTQRPFNKPNDPNWVATVGPMGSENTKRYTAKVADLRKTDLRVDWSEIESPDGTAPNSAPALRVITEPVEKASC